MDRINKFVLILDSPELDLPPKDNWFFRFNYKRLEFMLPRLFCIQKIADGGEINLTLDPRERNIKYMLKVEIINFYPQEALIADNILQDLLTILRAAINSKSRLQIYLENNTYYSIYNSSEFDSLGDPKLHPSRNQSQSLDLKINVENFRIHPYATFRPPALLRQMPSGGYFVCLGLYPDSED